MTRLSKILFVFSSLACFLSTHCVADPPPAQGVLRQPLDAHCQVSIVGVGTLDVETDYLPHVVGCENGAASYEALRAQAVAARSFTYYKLNRGESITDGEGDQVYSCSAEPSQEHYDAVSSTSGEVIMYGDIVVCTFYVAGAIPTARAAVHRAVGSAFSTIAALVATARFTIFPGRTHRQHLNKDP